MTAFILTALLLYVLIRADMGAECCGQLVCLSVCPRAYLWNHWTDLHEVLCRSLLTVARPLLAALRYVMYIRFYGWRYAWP